jgi:hypothetical protein
MHVGKCTEKVLCDMIFNIKIAVPSAGAVCREVAGHDQGRFSSFYLPGCQHAAVE